MTDRDALLARVARRLGQRAPRRAVAWDSGASLPAAPPDMPLAAMTERFLAELARLGGRGIRAGSAAEAVAYVVSAAAEAAEQAAAASGSGPVLLWDDPLLGRLGLAGALAERGLAVAMWESALGPAALKDLAAGAPAGVTGARWGAAETGTIALDAGPGRGRLVSLLPRTHIALLPESRLVASVAELFRQVAAAPDLPSSLALATGPSRSADIENDLSIGVHGPADVHVVLVPE